MDNNKIINLPVPFGSTVYTYVTTCGDFCLFQSEKFLKRGFCCGDNSPCHTKLHGTRKIVLNYETLGRVLTEWGKTIFATPEEAAQAGKKLIKEHQSIMLSYGFLMDENGYSDMSGVLPKSVGNIEEGV